MIITLLMSTSGTPLARYGSFKFYSQHRPHHVGQSSRANIKVTEWTSNEGDQADMGRKFFVNYKFSVALFSFNLIYY